MMGLRPRTNIALGDAERVWAQTLTHVDLHWYDRPSGCGRWTVAELINHVAGGGERYGMLLAGRTADDTATTRGNDYVGNGPLALFWAHENAFRAAASIADLSVSVDHRAGPRTGHSLVDMRIMDLTLHAYDLSGGLRVRWQPSDRLVRYLLDEIPLTIAELRRLDLFGPAIATSSDNPADQLLALAGRPPAAT